MTEGVETDFLKTLPQLPRPALSIAGLALEKLGQL